MFTFKCHINTAKQHRINGSIWPVVAWPWATPAAAVAAAAAAETVIQPLGCKQVHSILNVSL